MLKMAKPRVTKHGEVIWLDSAEDIAKLGDYCDQDIRTEHELDKAVPDLSPYEQLLWELDQIINDRGIPIDVPAVMRAVDVVAYAKTRADAKMKEKEGESKKTNHPIANMWLFVIVKFNFFCTPISLYILNCRVRK
jgi:DNA polymerase